MMRLMSRYVEVTHERQTPQSEAAKPTQRKNAAGGYSFVVDDWTRLERFL